MTTKATRLLLATIILASTVTVPAKDKVPPMPIVQACVGADGQLLSVNIVKSSGIAEIDEAALKIAWHSKFTPGKDVDGKTPLAESCVKFRVKFVLQDGKPVPEGT